MAKAISFYCDGGARGNPGPAASAFLVYIGEELIYEHGQKIGNTTNNVAEYQAVLKALVWLKENLTSIREKADNLTIIKFLLDSELVVNQLIGKYKIRNDNLRNYVTQIKSLEKEIPFNISYSHIPRTQNKKADYLVNKSLDETF